MLSFALLICGAIGFIHAQGCSDAGICTMPAFKPKALEHALEWNNRLGFGVSAGGADHAIAVFGANLDYSHRLGQRWNADTRLTFLSQRGNEISVAGLGDAYLSLGYQVSDKITLTGGVKLPLADGNTQHNGLPLPMDFQSSLGTVDLIIGAGYHLENWQVLVAWQHPLTDNENRFEASYYSSESPLAAIQSTNEFKRKGDVMVRVAHPVVINDKLVFTPSLLPIYHLGPDVYTDETGFASVEREIGGSDGLTLNAAFQFDIRTGPASALQFSLGTPLLVRKARPDGLTRGFVMSMQYGMQF